jgi:hypothetical protein
VSADDPADAQFGAFNVHGTTFSVTSSTISGNSAPVAANVGLDALAMVKNTIVSNPLGGGANCSGAATSLGFNLTDGTGCGFVDATDKPSTDPVLSSTLSDNGGPTTTLAVLTGSPAIDAGVSSVGETVDQRGLTRPVDLSAVPNASGSDGTDMGAFEVQAPPPPTTTPPTTQPPVVTKKKKKKCKKHKHPAAAAKKKCKKKKK